MREILFQQDKGFTQYNMNYWVIVLSFEYLTPPDRNETEG